MPPGSLLLLLFDLCTNLPIRLYIERDGRDDFEQIGLIPK